MNLIADTGLLVAFLNRRDQYHQWAVNIVGEAQFPVLTCDAVITESAWHLQDSKRLLELLADDIIRPALDCRAQSKALLGLAKRYDNRGPDFCDLCVVRMSELFPDHTVATVDRRDFSIYRRFVRQSIPTTFPE
jgi:predicted nucleic acid-binding protein